MKAAHLRDLDNCGWPLASLVTSAHSKLFSMRHSDWIPMTVFCNRYAVNSKPLKYCVTPCTQLEPSPKLHRRAQRRADLPPNRDQLAPPHTRDVAELCMHSPGGLR